MAITIHPNGRIEGFSGTSMPTGSVIQVKSASKTDAGSKSNTQSYDIPGLSVTITPTSASNKIFIIFNVNLQSGGSFGGDVVRLIRDSTNICIADANGSNIRGSNAVTRHDVGSGNYNYTGYSTVNTFLDSPGDTNAHTYKVNLYDDTANNTVYINRDADGGTGSGLRRTVSTITVMEIAT